MLVLDAAHSSFWDDLAADMPRNKRIKRCPEPADGQEKGDGDGCSEMNAGHINLFEQGYSGAGAGQQRHNEDGCP